MSCLQTPLRSLIFSCFSCDRYIQGASSPKNVIIVIDASGSMHGVPMKIAKLSAQTVIDILEEDDFFNVVYVRILSEKFNCWNIFSFTARNSYKKFLNFDFFPRKLWEQPLNFGRTHVEYIKNWNKILKYQNC